MDEYCLYLRKSRIDLEAEANGQGDTLARHRAALLKLAQKRGFNITGCYEEVRSGESIAARPEMQRLLNDVEDGRWAGVLVMEVERLARGNTTDQGIVADTFKYSDTKIVTPNKIYDPGDEFDEEYFEFGLFMSRREYKTINRRLQRGRRASLSEGKYIAGKATYGYERYKLSGEKGYSLRIIPEQAEIVRQIYNWYVNGELLPDGTLRPLGSYTIAKRLDARGIPSTTGGKWPPCTVKDILTNPTYIGKLRWSYRPTVKRMVDGELVKTRPVDRSVHLSDGRHEPILDEVLWHRAQLMLKNRSHAPVPKSTNIRNPLAGLLICSKCGRSMERRKFKHGRDTVACPNKDCTCKSSVLEEVEAGMLDSLRIWLSDYKVKLAQSQETISHTGPTAEQEITSLQRTLGTLQAQMENLYNLVEQGVYSTDLFLQRSQALTARMAEVNQQIESTQAALTASRRIARNRFEIIPRIERVLALYPTLTDPREKNTILKEVLEKILYTKTTGSRWEASDMNLYVFPRVETDGEQL